jgi:hypothetical protein
MALLEKMNLLAIQKKPGRLLRLYIRSFNAYAAKHSELRLI